MKIKTIVLFLILSFFFLAEISFAGPITLPDNTPLFFQFTNIELVGDDLTVPGTNPLTGNSYDADFGTSDNWGLLKISTLVTGAATVSHTDIQGGGTPLFTDMTDGQITGVFYDIQIDPVDPTRATGGILDFYWSDTSTVDANVMAGIVGAPDAATVSLFNSGTFLGRLNFDTGILNDGSNTTIKSTTDPTTLGTSGQGDSFASVDISVTDINGDVGAWADSLNGDWFWTDPDGNNVFDDYRDVRFSTFYNGIINEPLNNWATEAASINANALRSNDPGRVFTATTIPEPGTFFLFGLGLLGVAGTARRRKS